ncbi:ATP-binding domain-containing protein [Phytomonospora endophytica]|uniref:ATP-binding domain-containing protein n=1 Tax=Phytomonospora endophytica TaxID=714109 RepID=UPI004063AA15
MLWLGEPRQVAGATSLRLGAAVGREFRVVIVPGADAEALPVDTASRRRLFVALTRARDLVYLTHVGTPSPLLAEMHSGLVRVYGHVPDEVTKVEQPRLL